MPVILAKPEVEGGGSWSEASLRQKIETLSKYKLKQKGLGAWLKCRMFT
jgi:hypothetical protein